MNPEDRFWVSIWAVILGALIVIVLLVGSFKTTRLSMFLEAVKAGADPIALGCARVHHDAVMDAACAEYIRAKAVP